MPGALLEDRLGEYLLTKWKTQRLKIGRYLGAGEDPMHSGHFARLGYVNSLDPRMRVSAANESDVQRTVDLYVVYIGSLPKKKAGIFDASDALTYELACSHCYPPVSTLSRPLKKDSIVSLNVTGRSAYPM
jgi:hypothetical protein